jgi:Beta-lactamase class A
MARDPRPLKAKLDAICERFRGVMGYSLYHTRHNHRIDLRGDEIFPTASTIKVAVMSKAMEEIDAGRLNYAEKLPITPDDIRDGSGLLQFYKENQSVEVKMLLHLMITVSDNTATIMLARRLGTVEVNRHLERLGLRNTKLLALHPPDDAELKALRDRWGMGMCTPNEMVQLLDAIRTYKAASPAACERMLRIMSHQYYDDLIGGSVPPWVVACTKSGAISRSRSDVGMSTRRRGRTCWQSSRRRRKTRAGRPTTRARSPSARSLRPYGGSITRAIRGARPKTPTNTPQATEEPNP